MSKRSGARQPKGSAGTEGYALSGVTVLDLSTGVAGPYCTRLLAGLGAQVIKVEPPGGDPTRLLGPFIGGTPSSEGSALFHHLNAAKKSVTLDVDDPSDGTILRELLARSQVVVESFSPGRMAELGLGYETLRAGSPALVMTSITHFGQSHPDRGVRGDDLIDLALGGLLFTSGEPDREPISLPGNQALYAAGLNAAVATIAALLQAEVTGRGEHVDVAVVESVLAMVESGTLSDRPDNPRRRRQGNRHGEAHPMTLLPCKDGYVAVMVPTDADWELFALVTGIEALQDPKYATVEGRRRNAGEIDAILEPWLRERTRDELFHFAQELRLPFAMVLSPAEVIADPQLKERGFFSYVEHPAVGPVLHARLPWRSSGSGWQAGRAPLLGEHTAEVTKTLLERDAARGERADRTPTPIQAGPGGVLKGLRVVDLTTMWAGPLCTRILADLGAEVIKIEPPTRPDGMRASPARFTWLNRNKRSLSLDLNTEQGKSAFRELVRASGVVVENFSPRVMRNFGLDYNALREVRPDLIMLSMPAYGSNGPYRDYVAYGPSLEAMAGMSWLGGYAGGPPLLSGSAFADPVAGFHGAVALLAALRHRRRTGRGQWIDLSQWESLLQFLGEFLVLAGIGSDLPPHSGNTLRAIVPYGCYRCSGDDQWLAIAVETDEDWKRLCLAIGRPEIADDPRYRTAEARRDREGEVRSIIERWTRRHEMLEAMRTLQAAGVAAGAVLDGAGLLGSIYLRERRAFVLVEGPDGQKHLCPGIPWKTSGGDAVEYRPAPRLGQHNDDILSTLPSKGP